jgi:type IV pilus assembly protein PilQ
MRSRLSMIAIVVSASVAALTGSSVSGAQGVPRLLEARPRSDMWLQAVSAGQAAASKVQARLAALVGDGAASAGGVPAAGRAPAATTPEVEPATEIEDVRTEDTPGGLRVTLRGNGRLTAARVLLLDEVPHRFVLDFEDVDSLVPPVTVVQRDPLERVRVGTNSHVPLVTRVVLDLSRSVRPVIADDPLNPTELTIVVPRAASAKTPVTTAVLLADGALASDAATPGAAEPAGAPEPWESSPETVTPAIVADAPTASSAVIAVPAPAPAAPMPPPAAAQPVESSGVKAGDLRLDAPPALSQEPTAGLPQAPAVPGGDAVVLQEGRREYSGHPVSLDFQGVDLRAVLRTFAEITGLNLVIDPGVQGTVDVSLRDVPWDQALDIILRANQLGYVVDGTIVRIAPLTALAAEEKDRRRLAEEQALSGELRVLTRSLSYAKAVDLAQLITRSALSARGTVQVDERTNTLIIRDLQPRLDMAGELLNTLDRPQPQVEIEARIVQTSRDFARAIGVQWGFQGRATPELGNTLPFSFPSRGVIGGRQGLLQGPTDPGTSTAEDTSTAVNLGAPNATSAAGLALSAINGAFNLDVALSALERNGKGRVLSTPRVSTQNNVAAEVMQGIQIPIQTVANNTITVTFKDAALSLKVTPQITASQTVIMRIELENATPDFSRQVNGIPPIDTQRAYTQVLVSDGATTVIGGIFVSREQSVADRTPVLHRLPLLGWLFKRDSIDEENRELLIFITPRIIRS